ncbi:MAG: glycosyltransferase 87 family protein [Candidatus Sulfotelmatobacter sp.]
MRFHLWLVLSLCVSGIAWLYVHRIQGPWADHRDAEKNGLTQMGDLYPRWLGTRELLLRRHNPYGPEVSHEIQIALYGHVVPQNNLEPGHKIIDEQRFVYPLYVVFLMAPTVYADFADVQRLAPFVLGLFTAMNVLLCLQILHWRLPRAAAIAMVLFTLSSPQIAQGLRHQQLALVVGFLLTAGAWCISRNHLAAGGALLAFSTIKPQMAFLPLCWFAIWAAGDWPKRWQLPAAFLATLAALIGASELLLPGWFGYFLAGTAAYRKYFPTSSLLRMALGDTPGEILGGLLVLGLLVLAWRHRRVAADSQQFAFIFAAFLMGTILAFPLFTPFNQVMLILPAMLLMHDWKALPRFARLMFLFIVSWPWIISAFLLIFPPQLNSTNQLPLLPSFLISFFPLILPLLIMTKRSQAGEPWFPATGLSATSL